jgi:hypothetical protein
VTRVQSSAWTGGEAGVAMQSVDGLQKRAQPRGGSRKGRPNKMPRLLREMVLRALELEGGVEYLREQARKRNPAAFMALVGRAMPLQVQAGAGGLTAQVISYEMSPDALRPIRGVLNSPIREHVWGPEHEQQCLTDARVVAVEKAEEQK